MLVLCDAETTTYNKGNPFDIRNRLISYSIKVGDCSIIHKRYDDLDFVTFLAECISKATIYINVNCKFDLHWFKKVGITLPKKCRVFDCQLAEFVLSGQRNSFASLNSLAEYYGLPLKLDAVAEYWEKGVATEDIPSDVLEEYNNYDVELTWQVYLKQQDDPRMTPELNKLIILQGLDLLVLQEMEWNGLKYNIDASKAEAAKLQAELEQVDARLQTYAGGINLDSGDELSCFLFGGSITIEQYEDTPSVYKSGAKKGESYMRRRWLDPLVRQLPGYFTPVKNTELKKSKGVPDNELKNGTRYYATGADIMEQLKCRTKVQKQIVEDLKRRAYLQKLVSTYLEAIPALLSEKNWGEYIHGQYNQVVARTGRLSSSQPNLQNTPGEVDQFIVSRYT